MGFVADFVEAVVDVIVAIVEIVIQIVEVVIEFIVTLLGYDESVHTIEYFEIHNLPLFSNVDTLNPLLETMKEAIISDSDISGELIYASVFREYKGEIHIRLHLPLLLMFNIIYRRISHIHMLRIECHCHLL